MLDPRNNRFRTISTDRKLNPYHTSNKMFQPILNDSHASRMYNIISNFKKRNIFANLYRQGFEFLESTNNGKNIICGLNFVSFQNDLKLLFELINFGFGNSLHTDFKTNLGLENYISILAAGIFLVPPVFDKKFPGFNLLKNT